MDLKLLVLWAITGGGLSAVIMMIIWLPATATRNPGTVRRHCSLWHPRQVSRRIPYPRPTRRVRSHAGHCCRCGSGPVLFRQREYFQWWATTSRSLEAAVDNSAGASYDFCKEKPIAHIAGRLLADLHPNGTVRMLPFS
jgi:hypothetical protein